MTTEELVALGITQEQANEIFAIHGRDITALRGEVSTLTLQNSQLQSDSKELATLRQENMTSEQLQQQIIDEANSTKDEYAKKLNKLEAEKILMGAGMTEDDYKGFIDSIVTTDAEGSKNVATAMASTFKARTAAADEQARNDQLKDTPRPEGDGGSDSSSLSNQEKIATQLAAETAQSTGFSAYLKGE